MPDPIADETKPKETAVPTPTPEPVLTEAELAASQEEFLANYGGASKAKPKEVPKQESPAAAAPVETVKADEKKAEDETKPKKKKPTKLLDEQPKIDTEALAEAVARHLPKAGEQPKQEEPDPDPDFSEDERETLDAVRLLNQRDAYKGRNLVAETKSFWKKEQDYAAKWEQEHKGEKFEQDAEEHTAFYERFDPKISGKDLDRAKREITESRLVERAKKETRSEYEAEIEELRTKEAMRTIEPEIVRAANQSVISLVAESVPEFKALMDDGQGNLVLTQENMKKMEELNPEAIELLDEESHALKTRISELNKMFKLGRAYPPNLGKRVELPNGDTITPHADIADAAYELETSIAKLPYEERKHEGKDWISKSNLSQAVREIDSGRESKEVKNARIDSLLRRHWTIGADHIADKIRQKSVRNVSRLIALSEKIVSRKNSISAKSAEIAKSKELGSKPDAIRKIDAPSVASSSDTAESAIPGQSQDVSSEEEFLKNY